MNRCRCALLLLVLLVAPLRAQELVFAVIPWETETTLEAMHRPILDALEAQTGLRFRFYVARSYDDLVLTMQQGQVQIGIYPPVAYVQAKQSLPGLQYIATMMNADDDGRPRDHYLGYILSLRSSAITSLEHLRGTRFGFTAKSSSSGYKYPCRLLLDHGIDPETAFSHVFMLKKHPYVTDALARGSIDAGATWNDNLIQAQRKHGDIFRIVAQTQPIPLDACTAAPGVPPETVAAIRRALIGLRSDGPALTESRRHAGGLCGFAVRSDAFYNPTRVLLGIEPAPADPAE